MTWFDYVISLLESKDEFEMAPIYRLLLFAVPIINLLFLIASIHEGGNNGESYR